MKTLVAAFVLAFGFAAVELRAQNEPNLIPDVVDPAKLIPILPEAPTGWTAEKAEGSSDDVGGFKITNVHRDYRKVEATTGAWNQASETAEGYGKPVTIDGNPGREDYDKERKQASLWVMVAKRYFVEIELQNQEPKELQDWIKRVDLKKLAEIRKQVDGSAAPRT